MLPEYALKNGLIMIGLSFIWFVLAFITGKRRVSASVFIYLIIGMIFFVFSCGCLVYAFINTSILTRVIIIAAILVSAVLIFFIISIGMALKNRDIDISDDSNDQKDDDSHNDDNNDLIGFE